MKIKIENLEIEIYHGSNFSINDNNQKFGNTIYGGKLDIEIFHWNSPEMPITYLYYKDPYEMINAIKSYIDVINRHPNENIPDIVVSQLRHLIKRLLDINYKINNTPWKKFIKRLKKSINN